VPVNDYSVVFSFCKQLWIVLAVKGGVTNAPGNAANLLDLVASLPFNLFMHERKAMWLFHVVTDVTGIRSGDETSFTSRFGILMQKSGFWDDPVPSKK